MSTGSPSQTGYGKIVDLLIEIGMLTEEQVRYGLRVQSKIKTQKSLLEVIRELDYITDEQVRQALQKHTPSLRIGDFLVELGIIAPRDLEMALQLQKEEGHIRKLGEVLVAHNLIEERALIRVLSLQLGFPFIEPDSLKIDPELFKRGSVKLYERHFFIPVRHEDDHILVAFADPLDKRDLDAAAQALRLPVTPAIATKPSIRAAIEQLNPQQVVTEYILAETGESVVDIVNAIIVEAIEAADVSDIHIDPLSDRLRVRFRLDGVLVHHRDYPMSIAAALSSRIKVLCKADIAERRRHQGGRILFDHQGHQMDIRVSFYATVKGEKIVFRLLNRQTELLDIGQIGMSKRVMHRFREDALDRPSGVILITGPTGSGKTTTVYSCINHLNTMETSIITAEDPVEYVIDGIGQCSIDPKINLTYEDSLRHIVRQDPDIIVIGEIRDSFSAEVAVQAALTGHKVLTTFHTEDSIGGLLRLLNMDIDAFLISSTVVCVVAQRLLRRVCPHCAQPYELSPMDLLRIGCEMSQLKGATFRKGRGCNHCRYTGYRKRVAAFEVLVLNEAVRDGLIQRKTSHQIRHICTETTGLVTLFEDGLYKAARGITTIEEIMRCLPRFQKPRPLGELERLLGK
ncbi:GspE/PulE family protein [Desulfosarcina ovata]|uniref:Type II secretion system protein E n=1 Tax=Desulfosarcina ovata subsp. ovata TaxID=2752305 RepID=A0A5K8A9T3_9BACT|nr:GspE/PulE family protein [Desulfosarcina ovata]BBO89261.1 type II secretion system protein E [Desulfosarcina ovata subsp. ovata]